MRRSRVAAVAAVLSTGVALVYAASAMSFAAENDARASDAVRVSVTIDGKPAGTQGLYANSDQAVSGDGRLVAFGSSASNLVPGDTNNTDDVFVRDVVAGTTSRVSVSGGDKQGNNASQQPAISTDGKYVIFKSDASNLVADDTNAKADIFVRNLATGTVVRASLSNTGKQGNGNVSSGSNGPADISSDGRYVTFWSEASNLVDGDTNNISDLFLRDLVAGTTTRLSVVTGTGEQAKGAGGNYTSPLVAGRYVAFNSGATNLVPGDTNNAMDVFVRDIVAGTTTRVSVSTDGTQTNKKDFLDLAISQDGQRVFFSTYADDLVAGDTNNDRDVFMHDMVTRTTTVVSVHPTGSPYRGGRRPSVSADGQRVVFDAHPGITSSIVRTSLFVRDLAAGTTTQIDLPRPGAAHEESSEGANASISADGRYVAFQSNDDNLMGFTTDGDIFLRRLAD